jgi:hypothetical protein
MTEPWRTLYKRLIVLGAAIVKERRWGDPLNQADAEKQDDALAELAAEARAIADLLAASAMKTERDSSSLRAPAE